MECKILILYTAACYCQSNLQSRLLDNKKIDSNPLLAISCYSHDTKTGCMMVPPSSPKQLENST